jgi:hypothetical protein
MADNNELNIAGKSNVLVIGAYYSDKPNTMIHVVEELKKSKNWNIKQKWLAMGSGNVSEEVSALTVIREKKQEGKSINLNRLLKEEDLDNYDFVIICDDDLTMPEDFLDRYLDVVIRYDFALAQPSRIGTTSFDITKKVDGLVARRTRIVEGGPFVSMRRDAALLLLPLNETSRNGWGEHLIWPYRIEKAGLRIGIVDIVGVEHKTRKVCKYYDYNIDRAQMKELLSKCPHLSNEEAHTVLEEYLDLKKE